MPLEELVTLSSQQSDLSVQEYLAKFLVYYNFLKSIFLELSLIESP